MIESFSVGAVFKIINEASPQLTKILRQVRELQGAIDKAKANISAVAKMPGLAAATGEAKALATEWREVAKAAASANRSIGAASRRALTGPGTAAVAETQSMADAWERIAAASVAARGGGRLPRLTGPGGGGGGGGAGGRTAGGGGRHQPGWLGGHASGPSAPIPGGGHMSFSGGAAAALGLAGYAVYQAAQYEDATVLMAQHAGVDWKANRDRFRKVLQDASVATGFGEHDVALAAQQELRMFGDTGGSNGVNVLPKMLRYAATEARLKGTSLDESMTSLTGLAHMLQKYGEADVDKIAPAFSALSVRNPMSLAQQERAFGYAVPLLQSSLGMDPFQVMAGSAALARAGITNTKGGTWLRELAIRAMPGTSLMSKMAFKKHEEALRAFDLVDDKDIPTWFTDGHGDFMKLLKIASANAARIPMEKRASYERQLFGAQGSGALAVLAEPAVRQQMMAMYGETQNPENVNRVRNFMSVYGEQSTVQSARTSMQEFNVLMSDIGTKLLPPVNQGLGQLRSILQKLDGILPKPAKTSDGRAAAGPSAMTRILNSAMWGTGIGASVGAFEAGIGAIPGAGIGLVTGAGFGVSQVARDYMNAHGGMPSLGFDRGGTYTSPGKTGKPAQPVNVTLPQQNVTLNIDGQTLAQAILNKITGAFQYDTTAPAADGVQLYGP